MADRRDVAETNGEAAERVVRRRAHRVESLAEEAARGGGEREVEDLGVGESMLPQRLDVRRGDGRSA